MPPPDSDLDARMTGRAPRPDINLPPQSRIKVDPDSILDQRRFSPGPDLPSGKKGVSRDEGPSSSADRMRQLFMGSSQVHTFRQRQYPNPIWMEFDDKPQCVKPVLSEEHMRELLRYHSNADDVMIVAYGQEGCTACNALEKVTEWLCHDTRKAMPNLHFYSVRKEQHPTLVKGLVRFPQVKGFSAGQWVDIDFKPPEEYREMQYNAVQKEVHAAMKIGKPLTAVQAEEMYFSASGPAIAMVIEESVAKFYNQTQTRLHNYWKQVSQRRAWFFKKFLEPQSSFDDPVSATSTWSVFGEAVSFQPAPYDAAAARAASSGFPPASSPTGEA